MSVLSFISKIFGITSFEKAPQPQDQSFKIPYDSLIKIFQPYNTAIFDLDNNIPTDSETIQATAAILIDIENAAGFHLADTKSTKIKSISFHIRKDASIMTFIEYRHTVAEDKHQDCAVLLIASFDIDNNPQGYTAQFAMAGQYTRTKSVTLDFSPLSTVCLGQNNGEEVRYNPIFREEFIAAIAYADQAFRQLLSGEKIDPLQNQEWLNPERSQEAADLYKKLIACAAHERTTELKLEIK
jgi:hypothetical protein